MKKALPLLIGLLLALIVTQVSTIGPTTNILGDGVDNYEYFGFQYLTRENLQQLKHPFAYSTSLRYPQGFDFGYGYDGVLAVLSGAFLGFSMPQVLAYNLTVVLILALNFFFTYLLTYKISRSPLVGIICGIIFGLSPYVIARSNAHLNLAFIGGWPFFAYMLISLWSKYKKSLTLTQSDHLLLSLSMLFIVFGSLQYGIILVESVLLLMVLVLFINPQLFRDILTFLRFLASDTQHFLVALSATIVGFAFFYWGYVRAIVLGLFSWHGADFVFNHFATGVPQISDLFLPNGYLGSLWKSINYSSPSIEKVVTLGIIETGLLLWLLIREQGNRRIFLIVISIVFCTLILHLVSFPLILEGGRWIVPFTLLFVIFLASSLSREKSLILFIVILILVFERFSFTIQTSPTLPQKVAEIVRERPGKAVLTVPLSKYNAFRSTLPYHFDKDILDGYFHYPADNEIANRFLQSNSLLHPFICSDTQVSEDLFQHPQYVPEVIDLLNKNDIHTIVLFKNMYHGKYQFEECRNVRYWWHYINPPRLLIDQTELGYHDHTFEINDMQSFKAELFFPRGGVFALNGILLNTEKLQDMAVYLPDGTAIIPEWTQTEAGPRSQNDPLVFAYMQAGATITLSSPQEVREPVYVSVYYHFEPDPKSERVDPIIQNLYHDSDYEVYSIREKMQ